jgi:hypothetical protein
MLGNQPNKQTVRSTNRMHSASPGRLFRWAYKEQSGHNIRIVLPVGRAPECWFSIKAAISPDGRLLSRLSVSSSRATMGGVAAPVAD